MLCFPPDKVELCSTYFFSCFSVEVYKNFVNYAWTTDVFLAEYLSLAENKLKRKKPYEETLRMRMLKINIKILNIKCRSVEKLILSRDLYLKV